MIRDILKIIVVVFIPSIILSCVPSQKMEIIPPEQPIIVDYESTANISFKRIIFQIPPGTQIGAAYEGLANVKRQNYYWQTSISIGHEIFNEIANEELRNAGYNVIGGEKLLFDINEAWKANFLLGARIIDLKFNTYSSVSWENAEGSLTVEWELYNKNKREVIFRKRTFGAAKSEETTGTECLFTAFRIAISDLLADRLFVNKLALSGKNTEQHEPPNKIILINAKSLSDHQDIKKLINKAIESIVTIKVEHGFASGVIISSEGYVITNYHIIEGKNFIDATLSNGITLQMQVIRESPDYDLALLKINGSGFKSLPLGDSSEQIVGEEVFAIGTPFHTELSQSVTKGIISGKRIFREKEYIQTDVKVNPGNSGGPLINSKGEIIGIVTLKVVELGYEGLAFCIPVNIALRELGIKKNS